MNKAVSFYLVLLTLSVVVLSCAVEDLAKRTRSEIDLSNEHLDTSLKSLEVLYKQKQVDSDEKEKDM